ncbi:MAG: response regulator transcription factor [Tepidisphaera sp.]
MPTRPTMIIADPHPIVRHGLNECLGSVGGFRIVGFACDAQTAIQQCREHQPRVLLMELEMPGLDPLGAIGDIKSVSPQTAIVIFTGLCRDPLIEDAVGRGVAGYLLKSETLTDLRESLSSVLRGVRVYSKHVADRICHRNGGTGSAGPVTPLASLHPRELEVLRYIGFGFTNAEMAKLMHISIRTVERHVLRLMRSLKIDERTRLTALAHRTGLVR